MSTSPRATRAIHEYTQLNSATPEKVFPLLCPVREAEWVPGWEARIIYSQTGVAESGCVFTTPNAGAAETVWTVTHYDSGAYEIAFVWVDPGRITAQIRITLQRGEANTTRTHLRYVYTALSTAGEEEIGRYDAAWFQRKMQNWQSAINHYLETGKMIDAGAWE